MIEFQKLRLYQVQADGIRTLADTAVILSDDGESVSLAITTYQPDIEVSEDVDAELPAGMEHKLRIDELVREYTPTMPEDDLRAWAIKLVSVLTVPR